MSVYTASMSIMPRCFHHYTITILLTLSPMLLIACGQVVGDDPLASMPPVEPYLGEGHAREIAAFEQADAQQMPAPNQALFIGSSSIRLWDTLARDMAPAPVINRGFGGSQTPEVLAVFDRVVRPYDPALIVYYCGDNDLGEHNTNAQGPAMGFMQFAEKARAAWPDIQIIYIPIKASLARWGNWEAMERANGIVRSYCDRTPGMIYADTVTPTLTPQGAPMPDIFEPDGLHLNAKGYAIWTRTLRPIVLDAWARVDRD